MERQLAMCLMLSVLKVVYNHVLIMFQVYNITMYQINDSIFVFQEWFTLSSSVTDQEETY